MTELPVLVASLDRLSRVGLASVLDLPEAPGAGAGEDDAALV